MVFLVSMTAEEGSEDGHAAADYARAYFGRTGRRSRAISQRALCSLKWIELA